MVRRSLYVDGKLGTRRRRLDHGDALALQSGELVEEIDGYHARREGRGEEELALLRARTIELPIRCGRGQNQKNESEERLWGGGSKTVRIPFFFA